MKILVTGGAGYVGSHAVRALARAGHDIVIYDNLSTGHRFLADGFRLVAGDIGDYDRVRATLDGADAVMHFAASAYVGESVENPRKYFENNLRSAITLANATVDAGVKHFIFSSTCAVYGVPASIPIQETFLPNPVNPYGITKLTFERLLESYHAAYGLKYVALRYFNAAGADESGDAGELHEPETHLIPLVLAAAAGDQNEVTIFGNDYPTADGTCIRDYIHVSDLAEAHRRALEYLEHGGSSCSLNLGTGCGASVREVITAVEAETGRTVRTRDAGRRPGDPPALVADPRRARELLGWQAQFGTREIIASAWQWYQKVRARSRGDAARKG